MLCLHWAQSFTTLLQVGRRFDIRSEWAQATNSGSAPGEISLDEFTAAFESLQQEFVASKDFSLWHRQPGGRDQLREQLRQVSSLQLNMMDDWQVEEAVLEAIERRALVIWPGAQIILERVAWARRVRATCDYYCAKERGQSRVCREMPESAPRASTAIANADAASAGGVPQLTRRVAEAIRMSKASEIKTGVPWKVTFAQWALESGWRKKMSGKNNPFGIKAKKDQAGTDVVTHEQIGGKMVKLTQRFANYDSLEEAFEAHANLLAHGDAYAAARARVDDPVAFAHALSGTYATDSNYGDKLSQIMKTVMDGGKYAELAK